MVGDELVDHFVEGIAYTILPFASNSSCRESTARAASRARADREAKGRMV